MEFKISNITQFHTAVSVNVEIYSRVKNSKCIGKLVDPNVYDMDFVKNEYWTIETPTTYKVDISARTFTIPVEIDKLIEGWKKSIKEVFGEYGEFTYSFTSNGIGLEIKVYSVIADIEKDFTDVSSW